MNEKVLIKSEQYNVKKVFIILLVISIILPLIIFFGINDHLLSYGEYYDQHYQTYLMHENDDACGSTTISPKVRKCYECRIIIKNPTKLEYIVAGMFEYEFAFALIAIVVLAFFSGWVYFWLRSYELTVTDKRVYGKVAFGKRVDLPVDSVSAIATISLLKGVSVSTSSGRISFLAIKNADEIYMVMNNLLIERQQKKVNTTATVSVPNADEADQLKKFKELLDMGVITQEEFDAKKKQILGL